MECPKCGSEMKIISFIIESEVIRKILEHLGVWEEKTPAERAPPVTIRERRYEPVDDLSACDDAQTGGWPQYEEPFATVH